MKKILSHSLYILSLIPLIIYIGITTLPNMYLSEEGRLLLLISSTIMMYFAGVLLSKHLKDNKPMKKNLWIFFILYLVLVITLTLFDTSWGRNGIKLKNIDNLKNIKEYINLKPFKTIKGYLSYYDGFFSSRHVTLNLFGNFLAFMPMSIFLPLLFKKQNKWYIFLFTMIFMITSIEILQFITGSGRCDIDDLILNVGGAFLLYIILKIKCINALTRNILLLEKNKVSKFIMVIFVLLVSMTVVTLYGIKEYSKSIRNKRLENYYQSINYELKVENNTTDCNKETYKFYEDYVYEYYFECSNTKDDIIIYINNDKYTLDEVLADDFKFDVTIDRLNKNGLYYIRKNKYEYLDIVSENVDDYIKPDIFIYIEDEEILDVIKSDPGYVNAKYSIRLHLIPRKEGITKLSIEYINKDNNALLDKKEFLINIDENLNINYRLNSN